LVTGDRALKTESKSKFGTMALVFALAFRSLLWSQEVANPTPEKICQAFKGLISAPPVAQGATIVERTNHSSDPDFANRSASLIQGSIGGKLAFKQFHHLPFEITAADRKIEGNLFVFAFESESKLNKYLEHRPSGTVGKRGVLTAKAPQQFMAVPKGGNLIVLVVDGARVDGIVDELFGRIGRLSEHEGK
jgi:hypothetical protein